MRFQSIVKSIGGVKKTKIVVILSILLLLLFSILVLCPYSLNETKVIKVIIPDFLAHKDQLPEWTKMQIKRQTRLREFCANQKKEKLHLSYKDTKLRHNWLYSDIARVTYCSVPKVACTTWKKIFQVFEGRYNHTSDIKVEKDDVHELKYHSFDQITETDAGLKTQMYFNFIITRHPFERLVSAYRNKIEKPFSPYFQRTYGSQMLRMFRKGLTAEEYKSGKGVTFKEFTGFVIKVSMGNLDEHWRATYSLCNICGVKYDFIADMSTLYDDSDQVLKLIDWFDRVQFPRSSKDNYAKTAVDLTPEYLNRLPDDEMKSLYTKYKQDFDAFGYEFNLTKIRNGLL